MKRTLKESIGNMLPKGIKDDLRIRLAKLLNTRKKSYAQEGEDLILFSLFNLDMFPDRKGFYIDIGAHLPLRMSNTHLLHLHGWTGINVDPLPGGMKVFNAIRPNDINLEIGISASGQPMRYYAFNEPLLNGFDRSVSEARDANWMKVQSVTDIETMTLAAIIHKHLPSGKRIDLLSVDVEGLDLEVLQSNDWDKFRPSVVAVEDNEVVSLTDAGSSRIVQFLAGHGYAPYCKTPLTTFFAESSEVFVSPVGMRLRRYDQPTAN